MSHFVHWLDDDTAPVVATLTVTGSPVTAYVLLPSGQWARGVGDSAVEALGKAEAKAKKVENKA